MVQLVVEGVFLDLYQDDPIRLTLSIEDIEDGNVRSDYSKTFRVPATSNNNDFFHQAFEINGIDFDFTIKREASIYVDGILFRKGEIRLVKIYNTRDGANIDYECVFYGSIRSFSTSVGPGALCDLDLSGYSHSIAYTAVTKSWEAYPSGTTTSGLFNGDILYPLVNFGNTYSGITPNETLLHRGNGIHFTESNHPMLVNRFKPMIRAKVLFDKIFSDAGYTYTSDILSSTLFKKLYVSAWGDEASPTLAPLSNTALAGLNVTEYSFNGTSEKIQFNDDSQNLGLQHYDYGNNYSISNLEYTAPITGTYGAKLFMVVELPGAQELDHDWRLRIIKNVSGTETTLTEFEIDWNDVNNEFGGNGIVIKSGIWTGTLNSSNKIYAKIFNSGDTTINITALSYFQITDAPTGAVIYPQNEIDCNYKKIDFIKDILRKFRLVMSPDKNNPTKFNIVNWAEYIGSGEIYDWTEKLAVDKDFVSEPTFYQLNDRLIFEDQEDGDWLNKLNQDQFKERFGTLILDSGNDLLNGEKRYTTNFAPTPVTQIWNADELNNGMGNMIIPHMMVLEPEEGAVLFKPIKPKTRLLFYNGMKSVGINVSNEDDYYIQNDSGTAIAWRKYPMVSPYSDFPLSGTTLDLNWQREPGYVQFGLEGTQQGYSSYDLYWSSYINSLYNKWGRKVTAYFKLNSTDLQDFTFDDVVFVKNAYYYVTKISDVPIGQSEIVQVELIKLIGYTPPTTGFEPPELNLWNLDNDQWNLATQLWND